MLPELLIPDSSCRGSLLTLPQLLRLIRLIPELLFRMMSNKKALNQMIQGFFCGE